MKTSLMLRKERSMILMVLKGRGRPPILITTSTKPTISSLNFSHLILSRTMMTTFSEISSTTENQETDLDSAVLEEWAQFSITIIFSKAVSEVPSKRVVQNSVVCLEGLQCRRVQSQKRCTIMLR
jgi:hypothetical protein